MKLKTGARLNLRLYSLLLVITPFLLLQNYLQDAIGKLSGVSVSLGSHVVPVFGVIAILLAIVSLVFLVKNYSIQRLVGILIVLLLLGIGYNTSDYYFNHHFYDIQHNWHYFAYAIFSWLAWRHFNNGKRSIERMVLNTFLMALVISLMDEIIQVFISNRVFDLSDVAKDLWGCMIGQVFIHWVIFNGRYISFNGFWQKGFRNWLRHPAYLLSLELIFAWSFLNISSLLSDGKYAFEVLFFTLVLFFIHSLLLQLVGQRKTRVLGLVMVVFVLFYPIVNLLITQPKVKIVSDKTIVYKNIPVFYFDLMIYPNGMIRPVDKKESFNMRDQQKINSYAPDILLIGTGSEGQGGKGFNDQLGVEMVYNPEANKVYQVIKLSNEKAVDKYNELIRENKKVLMIIHNS